VHCKDNHEGYGFSRLHRRVGCLLVTVSERTVRPLGVELREWLFWLCRMTALHWASSNGHTETAMALVKAGADVHGKNSLGYGFSGLHSRVGWVATVRGGRSVHSGVGLQECLLLFMQEHGAALGVAERPDGDGVGAGEGGRGCARQGQRRVRFLEAASSCRWFAAVSGRTVRPLGVELKEVLLRLCRETALHWASQNGHTETAMVLVKAGADVHCKDTEGYGSRAAS
jgi:hypothetical protein